MGHRSTEVKLLKETWMHQRMRPCSCCAHVLKETAV